MKKLILSVLLFPALVDAQDVTIPSPGFPKNELGVKFLTVSDLDPWISNKALRVTAAFTPQIGVIYTHYFGKNAFKASSGFYTQAIDVNNEGPMYYYSAIGTKKNYGFNLGYERVFRLCSRCQVNPFIDATYHFSMETGRETAYGCFIYEDDIYYKRENDIFGGRIGLNFKYNINPYIVVSAESSFGCDKRYFHDLLVPYGYDTRLRYHVDPLDHLSVAFCF